MRPSRKGVSVPFAEQPVTPPAAPVLSFYGGTSSLEWTFAGPVPLFWQIERYVYPSSSWLIVDAIDGSITNFSVIPGGNLYRVAGTDNLGGDYLTPFSNDLQI